VTGSVQDEWIWQKGDDVVLRLRIRAQAKKTILRRECGSTLSIDVHAPPEKGKANEELVRFFSSFFKKPLSDVVLLHGHTSRLKLLLIKKSSLYDMKKVILETLKVIV
jgi:uncharacterized protein